MVPPSSQDEALASYSVSGSCIDRVRRIGTLPLVRAVHPETDLAETAGVLEEHVGNAVAVDVALRRGQRARQTTRAH